VTADLEPLVDCRVTFADVLRRGTCTVTGRLELKPFNQGIGNTIFALQMAHRIRTGSGQGRTRSKVCKK
jgi:hypothetical protein